MKVELISTGVHLFYNPSHGWGTLVEFQGTNFAQEDRIEGEIRTSYHRQDLAAAIDQVIAQAKQTGVVFGPAGPHIYVQGDGEGPGVNLPENWREIVQQQCDRLGWQNCYETAEAQRESSRS